MERGNRFSRVLIFIFLAIPIFTFAKWHQLHYDSNYQKINAAISFGTDFGEVYAVTDSGFLYHITEDDENWETTSLVPNLSFNGIVDGYSNVQNSSFLCIVGQQGTVVMYYLGQENWEVVDTPTRADLYSVRYNYYSGDYWAVGDSNTIIVSTTGDDWQKKIVESPEMKFKDFTFNYDNTMFFGDDGQNVYLRTFQTGQGSFNQVGMVTLSNRVFIGLAPPADEYAGEIYFLVRSTTNNDVYLMKADLTNYNSTPELVATLNIPNATTLGSYYDYNSGSKFLWIGTDDGKIYESVNRFEIWHFVYQTPQPVTIQTFVPARGEDHSRGAAFGAGGLFLINDFRIKYVDPNPNQILTWNQDWLKIEFSSPPEEKTLSAISIRSNFSGEIPLTYNYEVDDSSIVVFNSVARNPGNGIPGEVWQVSVGNGVSAKGDTNAPIYIQPFGYQFRFGELLSSSFAYDHLTIFPRISQATTNWVMGFFNDDPLLDVVTYGQDTIYCFYQQENAGDTVLILEAKIPVPAATVYYRSTLNRQLETADINNDGRPDLILFDDSGIHLFMNRSTDNTINFTMAQASYYDSNIRQVIPFDDDHNNQVDLMVLANSLKVLVDISESNMGDKQYTVYSSASEIDKIDLGDINGDGARDLIFLQNNRILTRLSSARYGFSEWSSTDTLTTGMYNDFRLGNMDNMGETEIVALAQGRVDIVQYYSPSLTYDHNTINAYHTYTVFNFNHETNVDDWLVGDFGGDAQANPTGLLDIIIVQEDSLFIYRNTTYSPYQFSFDEYPVYKRRVDIYPDNLLAGDFTANQTNSLIMVNRGYGLAQLLEKSIWKPTLTLVDYDAYHVELQWDVPPADQGTVQFYKLEKHWGDGSIEIFDVNGNTYYDSNVFPFSDITYSVSAVYDNGKESPRSNMVNVQLYHVFNGIQYGAVVDTTLPYLVQETVEIPAGDSLYLGPGVKIGFLPGTGMIVYGKIRAEGDPDHMVDFGGVDSIWNGVTLMPGNDSLVFRWFSINEAQTGMVVEGRTVHFELGGMTRCFTGVKALNSNLFFKNVLFDSMYSAMSIEENCQVRLTNIDVLHTLEQSIFAYGANTNVWIKNAIIWNNVAPVTATDSAKIWIRYSTVDSVMGRVYVDKVSKLPPIFNTEDEDMPFIVDPMSPTIDAGDPLDDYSREPQPNGGRINQGLFGNTIFATPSYQPRVKVVPQKMPLVALAGRVDSTTLYLKNWGYADLVLQNFYLKHGETGPFSLPNATLGTIPAQDSLSLPLHFDAPKHGTYFDTLLVFCNDPHLANNMYVFPIRGVCPNSLPKLLNQPPTEAYVDSEYVFRPVVIDADGDSVLIQVLQRPAWLHWQKGTLRGTPAVQDTGQAVVQLRLDDQFGGVDTVRFVIDVQYEKVIRLIYPLIRILPMDEGLISHQAAIRFKINVRDSIVENGKFKVIKEATNTYLLQGRVLLLKTGKSFTFHQEKNPIVQFDSLGDGTYRMWVRVNKLESIPNVLPARDSVVFEIRASKKYLARFRWHMVSLPRPGNVPWDNLHIKDSTAVLFRWNQEEEEYQRIEHQDIIGGQAYWLLSVQNLFINLESFLWQAPAGADVPNVRSRISLKPGWNQVGTPLPYYKVWQHMIIVNENGQEMNWSEVLKDSLITPAVYWFEQSPEYQGYHVEEIDSTAYAIPWRGYWMYSKAELNLYVTQEPEFPTDLQVAKLEKRSDHLKNTYNDWLWNLTLQSDNLRDQFNVIGVSAERRGKLPEPPYFDRFASLTFNEKGHSYCKVIKKAPKELDGVVTWDVSVKTTAVNKEHRLHWEPVGQSDETYYVYLVDPQTEKVINMNENSDYTFNPQKKQYTLKIYASRDNNFKPSIIPLRFKLAQNYPNPFNPTTTIKVGIPQSSANQVVSLKVFDVLGKEVTTLYKGTLQPGYHTFEWDGTNRNGHPVSSGIYFYQLQAGKTALMHKMILLR